MASTVKWTEKNLIYLSRLGFLDCRDGKIRKDMNMSGFINECVTMICETGMHDRNRNVASSEELRHAYLKYQIGKRNKLIDQLRDEIENFGRKIVSEPKNDENLEEFSKVFPTIPG